MFLEDLFLRNQILPLRLELEQKYSYFSFYFLIKTKAKSWCFLNYFVSLVKMEWSRRELAILQFYIQKLFEKDGFDPEYKVCVCKV